MFAAGDEGEDQQLALLEVVRNLLLDLGPFLGFATLTAGGHVLFLSGMNTYCVKNAFRG